jgi:hypothetical protein
MLLKYPICLQLWETWKIMWALTGFVKILENIKACFYDLDKECSELLNQRKQTELQWLKNPSQINGDIVYQQCKN